MDLHSLSDRFLRYVQIDTESDPHSMSFPSTEKQKDLAKVLLNELLEMGVQDAEMDEWGYVFATIPSNSENDTIPTICFCSHVDTAPDCSGKNVKPIEVDQLYLGMGECYDIIVEIPENNKAYELRLKSIDDQFNKRISKHLFCCLYRILDSHSQEQISSSSLLPQISGTHSPSNFYLRGIRCAF